MKKVKNVIKGMRSRYDIDTVTIIKGYKVQFSGNLEKYLKTEKGNILYDLKVTLDNSEVIATDIIGFSKLFIFIQE